MLGRLAILANVGALFSPGPVTSTLGRSEEKSSMLKSVWSPSVLPSDARDDGGFGMLGAAGSAPIGRIW